MRRLSSLLIVSAWLFLPLYIYLLLSLLAEELNLPSVMLGCIIRLPALCGHVYIQRCQQQGHVYRQGVPNHAPRLIES